MIPWSVARPILHCLPAECAHRLTLAGLRSGLGPRISVKPNPALAVSVWGRQFTNPLGLAAGFDKNAQVMGQMLSIGFGFVEVGTITPRPQPGNPRPRMFRLSEDRAVINRLGFNNDGLERAAVRVASFRAVNRSAIIGVNIGRNKSSTDAVADYRAAAQRLAPFADYLVVNVSSPNTPGLRDLQGAGQLAELVAEVRAVRGPAAPPVLAKIAPDLTDGQLADICALARAGGMDGLIVCNTTTARPDTLQSRHRGETGGLSGAPLMAPATRLLAEAYGAIKGRVPLVGVGGVASAADAYAKVRAGASLVQLYSALVYEGPELVVSILDGLAERLRTDGFERLQDVICTGVA